MAGDIDGTRDHDHSGAGSGGADLLPATAEVTNETLVRATMGSDQSISASTFTKVALDAVAKDERGEFDTTNNLFIPDETGWYLVTINLRYGVGADGDELITRLRDTTSPSTVLQVIHQAGSAADNATAVSALCELTAGNNYELQGRNSDSSDTIKSTNPDTNLTIRRAFR